MVKYGKNQFSAPHLVSTQSREKSLVDEKNHFVGQFLFKSIYIKGEAGAHQRGRPHKIISISFRYSIK